MHKIGFIGSGNMAYAIAKGIVDGDLLPAKEIMMSDINKDRLSELSNEGFSVNESASELVKNCEYVVFSIKPQFFGDVLEEIKDSVNKDTVFVSIAAGITADYIEAMLGYDVKLILVMPNTPVLLGFGTTAMSRIEPTSKDEFAFIKGIFEASGYVAEISPDKMNEVIPLNGSSPAFIYRFAEIFVEEGVRMGFDEKTSNELFCHALIGSAQMMLNTGKTHKELIKAVTSPGGTTLKGLEALERNDIEKAILEACRDCVARAYELGKK